MLSVAEYIAKASAKGPPRPGIILGIRMSVLAMRLLEIDDPSAYHRKLIVVVETDRCLPDVIELVIGCRLGNRTLKFRDWGKMAGKLSWTSLATGLFAWQHGSPSRRKRFDVSKSFRATMP